MPTLDFVLDQAMELPYDTRMTLIDLIKERSREEGRELLYQQVLQVRKEFEAGNYKSGTVQDLIADLDSDDE